MTPGYQFPVLRLDEPCLHDDSRVHSPSVKDFIDYSVFPSSSTIASTKLIFVLLVNSCTSSPWRVPMTDKDSSMESNLVRKFLTGARVVGYGLQEPG